MSVTQFLLFNFPSINKSESRIAPLGIGIYIKNKIIHVERHENETTKVQIQYNLLQKIF